MARALAATLFSLAVCGFQDPSAPLKWSVKLDSRFTMKYSYAEQHRSDVVQKGVGTKGETIKTSNSVNDRREVEADLSFRELPGREWALSIDLKNVTWTFATDEAEVTLTLSGGKDPQTRVNVRERDKLRIPQAKADAEQRAEHMKRLVAGEYDLAAERTGQVVIVRAGAVDVGFSLFGRSFVQPPCPSEPVTAGQTWKDTVPSILPGYQEAGIADLPFKVTSLSEKAVTVKGTANGPLTKPSNPGDTINGTFSLEREFVFNREGGHVQSSREEFAYRKNATNKVQFFGGTTTKDENVSASIKQSLMLKPRK